MTTTSVLPDKPSEQKFPRYFVHVHTDNIVRIDDPIMFGHLLGWPDEAFGPGFTYIINNPQHYREITEAEAKALLEK